MPKRQWTAHTTTTMATSDEELGEETDIHQNDMDMDTCIYDDTFLYLMRGAYPLSATKQVKGVIRKRSKKFKVKDGQLYRVCKEKNERERLCWFVTVKDRKTRQQVLEGCT